MKTHQRIGYAVLVAMTVALVSCGKSGGMSGKYEADMMGVNAGSLEFKSGGKVVMETMGVGVEMPYEVDGDNLKLISPQGALVLTINKDGSITGMGGLVYKKSK